MVNQTPSILLVIFIVATALNRGRADHTFTRETYADVVFALDLSSGVGEANFGVVLNFVANITSKLDIGLNHTRIGVLTFGDDESVNILFHLNEHNAIADITSAITSAQYLGNDGYANLALRSIRETMFSDSNGDRPDAPNVAVLVIAGPFIEPNHTIFEANFCKDDNITIFAIGVKEANETELGEIATRTNSLYVSEFGAMPGVENTAAETIRNLSLPGLFKCPIGTYADIIFILDSSGSVTVPHFHQMLHFIVNLVYRLTFDGEMHQTRIGIVSYDSRIYLEFHLNEYQSLSDLSAAILAIQYQAGGTQTDIALRYVRETMFTQLNGDRPGVPNIAVLLTDGRSYSPNDTASEAALSHADNIITICIGIENADADEINAIATPPYALQVLNFDELEAIEDTIIGMTCHASRSFTLKTCNNRHMDCNDASDPSSIAYSKCVNDSCVCVGGYFHDHPFEPCVPIVIGTRCIEEETPDDFCEAGVANSECGSNGCVCDQGYHPSFNNWRQMYCKHMEPGWTCANDATCQTGMAGSRCVGGECECPDGQVYVPYSESCETPLLDSGCSTCLSSGGVCFDFNNDSNPDTCGCPAYKRSTNASNIDIGCDISLVDPAKLCDPEGVKSVCRSANAECNHAKKLSDHHQCQCKLTYVQVPERFNPDYNAKCVKALSKFTDPNCKWCDERGGTCVDKDEDYLRDGCMCPATKSTSSEADPRNDCNTNHVNVTCLSNSLLVVYTPQNNTKFSSLLDDLMMEDGKVFIRHSQKYDECWFKEKGGTYSIVLDLSDELLEMCNIKKAKAPDGSSVTYITEVRIHRGKASNNVQAWLDFTFRVFCTYYESIQLAHGGIMVEDPKLGSKYASEGKKVSAGLSITVRDEFGQNAEETGITAGDNVQLVIEMINDGDDAYLQMKVETCLAADRPNLDDPLVQSLLLVEGGCPIGLSDPSFEVDAVDPKLALSEYFPSVSFDGSSFVYFHCSIRVCRNPTECPDSSCSRRRRSSSRRIRSYTDLFENVEYEWGVKAGVSSGGIFVKPRESEGNNPARGIDESFQRDGEDCSGLLGICGLNVTLLSCVISGIVVIATLTIVFTIMYRMRRRQQEKQDALESQQLRPAAEPMAISSPQAQLVFQQPVIPWWFASRA